MADVTLMVFKALRILVSAELNVFCILLLFVYCGEVAEMATFVQEGEVLLHYREQRDDGRLHALAAQDVPVLGHVS